MATGGTKYPLHVVHALTFTVNWNDAADLIAGTRARGVIPAGAHVIGEIATIQTVFNAASTNVLTVGTQSGTATNLLAAGDLDESSAATTVMAGSVFHAGGLICLNATTDTPIYAKYAQSGTAADAGKATISILYTFPRGNAP